MSHFKKTVSKHDEIFIVYVNGVIIGITTDAYRLHEELVKYRELKVFNEQISFYIDEEDQEIRVFSDTGRYIRPLLVVRDSKLLVENSGVDLKDLEWDDLLDKGFVRYVDSNEVEYSTIAMHPGDLTKYPDAKYDYCEIHPSLMFGVCSAVIPYPEHNQSPRLVYQSSMIKQALGMYALNYNKRFETVTHVMHYPQKPITSSRYEKILHYDEMLSGYNPIVAIINYTGLTMTKPQSC